MTRAALARWVDYARAHEAVILYDAAYEAYIRDPEMPHSIYEIEGAREVAIESRSFSKNAGFTGLRLAYTVVPREARGPDRGRQARQPERALAPPACRRSPTARPTSIQKAAAAVYTPEGQKQVRALIDYYMENARVIRDGLDGRRAHGLRRHATRPTSGSARRRGVSSWDFFDRLLAEAQVVGAPGAGFGPSGEGYFRLTAFGSRAQTAEAVERIATCLGR